MLRYLPFVLVIALTLYCAFDVLGSDERARRGLAKPLWLLIVLFPVVGGVVWLVVSRGAPHAGTAGAPRGPVAPDDDPEFLRRLDEERRRRERRDAPPPPQGTQDDGSVDGQGTTGTDATDGTPSS